MSIRSVLCITCVRSSNISDSAFPSCFLGARIDLSVEDNVVALTLAECLACPYVELIKSDIPGPSNLRSARSTASRPLPPSTMGVPPIGLSTATPTRGEILVQLGKLSRKPRSVKRKNSSFTEKDRPVSAKVHKLGASSPSPSTHVRKPERAPSPPSEAPTTLSSQSRSKSTAEAENPLGEAVGQPLAIVPITVWNPPIRSVKSSSRRAEESKRKDPGSESGGNGDSLLLNAELAVGAVSSILKDSDSRGRKHCPLMRLLP